MHQEALIDYEIDEYDERFLRHLALGYTKRTDNKSAWYAFWSKKLEKTTKRTCTEIIGSERKE